MHLNFAPGLVLNHEFYLYNPLLPLAGSQQYQSIDIMNAPTATPVRLTQFSHGGG